MSYNVQWQQVKQDVPVALTQHKSYGDSIGAIGEALSGFADAQRAKNTDSLLAQLAQAKNEEDMVLAQASILDAIQKKGGAVDGLGLLSKMQQQQDYVTERVASEEAKLGQATVLNAILNGQSSQAFQEATAQNLDSMSLAQKGPLAQHYQSLKNSEAAAQATAFDQKIKAGELGVKVQKANQDSVQLGLGVIDKVASNPGKEIQVPYYDPETGTTTYQTVYQPGYGDVFEGSGGSNLLGSLSGLGGATGGKVGSSPTHANVRSIVSKAESGNNYDALYGNSQNEGGKFSGVKVTDMTVNQALEFSKQGGDYANWSKTQKGVKSGTYATPMGAYQIVGSTLKDAAKGLGLTGNEKMTPELQDRIADWVLDNQGTGAFLAYKGPAISASQFRANRANSGGGGSNQSSTPTRSNASGSIPKGTGWQVTPEQAQSIPNMMQEYKRMRAEERNIEAASYNETADKFEFDNFLKKNNAHVGSTTLSFRTNNHNIVTHAETNPQYKGLSSANKQKVLTALFDWGKENQGMGVLNTKDALVRERIDKEIQAVVAAETQAEIAKELNYFRTETEKVYQELKKTNPSATLDQVRQWASPHHNKLLKNPKGTKAEVSSSKKGAPVPEYLKRKVNPKQGMLDSMLQHNPHIKYTPNPFG